MNETELNDLVSVASGLPAEDTSLAIMALVHVITTCMQQGKSVSVPGFGSFAVKNVAALPRRKSAAGAAGAVPSGRSVEFDPSVPLKNAVNMHRPAEVVRPEDDR